MSIVIKLKSAASVPTPSAGKVQIFQDIADNKTKVKKEDGLVYSVSSGLKIVGSRSAPTNISVSGITPPANESDALIYIQGNGGNINVTANPQIAAGSDGDTIELRGRNSAQKVLIEDGNGLSLNGSFNMGEDCSITLRYDSVNWVEVSRRENA